jgi:hypothetical protein
MLLKDFITNLQHILDKADPEFGEPVICIDTFDDVKGDTGKFFYMGIEDTIEVDNSEANMYILRALQID